MYDVADDLDEQRDATHREILALIEQEEDRRRGERGEGRAAASAAGRCSSKALVDAVSGPARSKVVGFDFLHSGGPVLPGYTGDDPAAFLSSFDANAREGHSLGVPQLGDSPGRLFVDRGPSGILGPIRALEGLAKSTRLRGEQLREDPRFCALLWFLDLGLRGEVMRMAVGNKEVHEVQQQDVKNESNSNTNSKGSSILSVHHLLIIARSLASLRVASGVDGVLRSLALLGMGRASEFDLWEGPAFLLSLAAAATPSYQPIQRGLLRAFRGPWAGRFLAAVAAASNNKATNSSADEATSSNSNSNDPSRSSSINTYDSRDSRDRLETADLLRQLLLLLPLFVSLDALGPELPLCLETLAKGPLWAALGAALRPGEIAAAAAAAAASPLLQQDVCVWETLKAAAERLGPTLSAAEVVSFCNILSQVTEPFSTLNPKPF